MSKLFSINWDTPLKYWWKAKKYFKIPFVNFYIGLIAKAPNISPPKRYSKVFDFYAEDVRIRKDLKNSSLIYEYPPQIVLVLFGTIEFAIWWTKTSDKKDYSAEYWCSILDFLFFGFKFSPVEACYNNQGKSTLKTTDKSDIDILKLCLKKKSFYNFLEYEYNVTFKEKQESYKIFIYSLEKRSKKIDKLAEKKLKKNLLLEFNSSDFCYELIGAESIKYTDLI